MKFLIIATLMVLATVFGQDKYTDKYDKMDLDEILANKRLLGAYSKCILEKGKCTPEGREIKTHIVEALQTGCVKCTTSQIYGLRKVIKHFIANDIDTWNEMVEKYDPKRIYSSKYEKQLKRLN